MTDIEVCTLFLVNGKSKWRCLQDMINCSAVLQLNGVTIKVPFVENCYYFYTVLYSK